MGKLIKTVTIDNDTQDIVEEVTDVIELSEMPWRKYLKMKNYNKDRYKMCEVCIAEQKRKYKGETPIICNGLRDYKTSLKAKFDENIIDSIVAELSEEEFDELQALFNPFDWFRVHMTDKSKAQDRWTQELALSCLDEDSPIAMSDGSYKKIKDIKVGDKVVSYNEVRRTLPINKVLNVWDRGYKESYKITLENGDSVIATDDHPFLGYFKTGKENKLFGCNSYKTSYLSIKDGLKVGDNLYTVNKSPVWGSFDNLEIAKLLGYICTDGYIDLKASKIQFRNIRKEYVDEFEKICLEQFQTKSTRKFKSSYCDLKTKVTRQDTWEVNIIKSKNLKDFLNSIGCIDKYSRETSIINFALDNFSEEACSVFINRVLSGDGCISKDKVQVSVSGKFKSEFLEKLSRLFRKVGVRRSKVYHSETVTGRRSALMVTESLSAKSLLSFTGPVFGKEFQCTEQLKIADANLQKWKTRRRVYNTTSRTKVISIEPVGKRHVYDIEVNKRHNFITNNIITHNCSAKNKAIRWGRRCIAEYEQVLMSDGTYKHIKDVKVNDKVLSFREDEAVSNTVLDVIDNGYKDIIYRVRLTSGRSVDLTSDHQILTKDGWKSIDEGLGMQDYVCENRSHSIDKKSLISRDEALSELSKRDSHNQRPFKTDTDFKYTRIKSISKIESKTKVYDLTIENDHNFITNGIVTHNCGKSYAIIMELMYKIALAEKPLSILVAAPMVTMIDEISQVFMELSNLIDIPNFIQSKKSSPILEITFFNGSILKGITAADDGKSARGKKADVIWIDEVDFVPTKALDAIRAIQLDNPNVELIYTSTPIGEGNLFNFANQKITKEFHYPTFTRPDYTDEMHSSTEALSAIAYAQEILAIYGLDEAGVFPIRFIDMAYDYYIKDSYNEDFVLNNRDRFILIIGVDWNHDNNGTRIVVLGHDRVYSKFFIVEKQRISKIKMTQTLAVQTIVDLNRKYNCDHIICDEGFGIAQVSMLRLKGEEQYGKVPPNHPDIKLVDTVAVSFGSTLEITDPVKHQTIKKNTKQYIVENAQKVLENNQLALDDLKDDEVILQMKNYHIARTGLRGNIYKPKDKKIGDHDLDALMLALYGFDMFYGAFIKPTLVEHGNILSKDVNYAAAGRTFGSEEYGSTLNTNLKLSRNNKRRSFKPRKRW